MKRILSFWIIALVSLNGLMAQDDLSGKIQKLGQPAQPISTLTVSGVSPRTAMLLLRWERYKTSQDKALLEQLEDEFKVRELEQQYVVNAFVITDHPSRMALDYGFVRNGDREGIITGLIPLDELTNMANDPSVHYIDVGIKGETLLEAARNATNVSAAHMGSGLDHRYTGEGVIVGIIDVGFDYTHPAFYDSLYDQYRITRVWEQESFGTPPTGFAYGRELVGKNAILNAGTDISDESHGTHVAGIAGGRDVTNSDWMNGVAMNSELVLVATSMQSTDIADGIEYIFDYAASQGKPCVINMSIGVHIGPHDGTSNFDQTCDALVDDGYLLVGAAGNEGGDPIYLGKTFTSTNNELYTLVEFSGGFNRTDGEAYIDIWGEPNKSFQIAINIYNATENTFIDFTDYINHDDYGTYQYTLADDDPFFTDFTDVEITVSLNPNNNKPNILVYVNSSEQDDEDIWVMLEILSNDTEIDMWAAIGGAYFTDDFLGGAIMAGSTSHTVGEIGGTGNSIISVGAYTSTNSYTNHSGNLVGIPAWAPVGEIAPFSSLGPTADGRTKPDIAAPGNVIIAPVSSYDGNYNSSSETVAHLITDGVNDWLYAALEGTSMASPMVAGIVALWLEANPNLSHSQAIELFKSTSISDSYTGAIPNQGSQTWGWGKIDANQGLQEIEAATPGQPEVTPGGAVSICDNQPVTLSAPAGFAAYQWTTGETTQQIQVSSNGNYSVRVMSSFGIYSDWSEEVVATNQPSPPTPTISINGNEMTSSAAVGNQWFLDGEPIPGATSQTHEATQSGIYTVVVTNEFGCSSESDPADYVVSAIDEPAWVSQIDVYPNPSQGHFEILSRLEKTVKLALYDIAGKSTALPEQRLHVGERIMLDLSDYEKGMYLLKVSNADQRTMLKLIVE